MFPEVQKCTTENVEKAKSKLASFDADFGGTEILEPLQDLFKTSPVYKQRQIFLLTDGEVSNTRDVINLAKDNAQANRFYTFGIGFGASTELVHGIASFGGKSKMLTDDDDLTFEVQKALEACQSVFFWDIELSLDLAEGLHYNIVSMDNTISSEPFQVFVVLRGEITNPSDASSAKLGTATLKAKTWKEKEGAENLGKKNKFEESFISFDMDLQIDESSTKHESLPIHRMAAKQLIVRLTHSGKMKEGWGEDEKYTDEGNKVLAISLASNVVSPVTSFLAIDPDAEVTGDMESEMTPAIAEKWNLGGGGGGFGGPMPMAYAARSMPMMPMAAPPMSYGYAPGGGISNNNAFGGYAESVEMDMMIDDVDMATQAPINFPVLTPPPPPFKKKPFQLSSADHRCFEFTSDSVITFDKATHKIKSARACYKIVRSDDECGDKWFTFRKSDNTCECVTDALGGSNTCIQEEAAGFKLYEITKNKKIILANAKAVEAGEEDFWKTLFVGLVACNVAIISIGLVYWSCFLQRDGGKNKSIPSDMSYSSRIPDVENHDWKESLVLDQVNHM